MMRGMRKSPWLLLALGVLQTCAPISDGADEPRGRSQSALMAQPELGTPDLTLGRAAGAQRSARLAMTSQGGLVVWRDGRLREPDGINAVFATRLSPTGGALDPAGLLVGTSLVGRQVTSLDVEVTPANVFLVVWTDRGISGSGGDVYYRRYDLAGPLDPAPVQLTTDPAADIDVSATFDGTNFLLVWRRVQMPERVMVTSVSPAGVRGPTESTAATSRIETTFIAARDDGVALVAWGLAMGDGGYESRAQPFIDGGFTSSPFALPGEVGGLVAASDAGVHYLVTVVPAPGTPEVHGRRWDAVTNLPIDGLPVVLATGRSPVTDAGVERAVGQLAHVASSVLVPILERETSSRRHLVVRVDPVTGTPVSEVAISMTGLEAEPASAAPLGGGAFFAFSQEVRANDNNNDDVFVNTLGGTPTLVSRSAESQEHPALANAERGPLVTWSTWSLGTFSVDLASQRHEPDAGTWSLVTRFGGAFDQEEPFAVGSTSGNVLVTHTRAQGDDLYGHRLSSAAALLDPAALDVCTATGTQFASRSTFDGTSIWVAWPDNRSATRAVFVNRVDPVSGQVLDGQGRALPFVDPRSIALASNARGEVIFVSHDGTGRLMLARAFADGGIDPMVRSLTRPTFNARPVAAFDGRNYLVAWEADEPGGGETVRAIRLAAALEPIDSTDLVLARAPDLDDQQVAFDGLDYLVTWLESADGGLLVQPRAGRVSLEGAVRDFNGVDLGPLGRVHHLRAVGVGGGRTLFSYQRFDDAPAVMSVRAKVVLIEQSSNLGTPCTASSQCSTGLFCVDGVCCNSLCGMGIDDCQACSVAAGALSDGQCSLVAPLVVCRASGGECDPPETCDGARVECPVNAAIKDGAPCATGVCAANACVADAGVPDAGIDDGGGDAGAEADGGTNPNPNDAGTTPDSVDGGPDRGQFTVGCGCSSPASAPLGLLALVLLALRKRAHFG